MSLNSEQLDLKKKLIQFIESNQKGFFGVLGSGGTGKTYTVCNSIDIDDAIFLGATNKVCSNLKEGFRKAGTIAKVKTIDSFFGFRMRKDENNKTIITHRMPKHVPSIIIIDEISLINQSTYNLLMQLKDERKFILIGDNMQIPPIEDEIDKVRDENGFQVSKIFLELDYKVTLTKQMRQKEGSNLYDYIQKVRNNMNINFNILNSVKSFENGNDILLMDINDKRLDDIIKYESPIAVCYKNITTMSFNYRIGKTLIGKDYKINDLNVGDFVFFKSFYNDGKNRFYTSEIVEIIGIERDIEKEIEVYKNEIAKVTYHVAHVLDERGFPVNIKIAKSYKETSRPVYYRKNKVIKKLKNKREIANLHTFYQDYLVSFAKLSKPFSITSHKAQGSTYDTVIVPIYDFASKFHRDRNQLFYVAISRAKKKLIFVTAPSHFKNNSDRYNFYEIERCAIASSQDWKCKTCEIDINDREYDIDHINELHKKGKNVVSNLRAICKPCHQKRHKK